jgi:hypothetical protein
MMRRLRKRVSQSSYKHFLASVRRRLSMERNVRQKRRDQAYFESFDRKIDGTAKRYALYNFAFEVLIVLTLALGTGGLIGLAFYELTHM